LPLGAEVGSGLAAAVGQGFGCGHCLGELISLVFGASAAWSPVLSWVGRGLGGCCAAAWWERGHGAGNKAGLPWFGFGALAACCGCCVSHSVLPEHEHLCLLPVMALFLNSHPVPSSISLLRLKMLRQVQTRVLC